MIFVFFGIERFDKLFQFMFPLFTVLYNLIFKSFTNIRYLVLLKDFDIYHTNIKTKMYLYFVNDAQCTGNPENT